MKTYVIILTIIFIIDLISMNPNKSIKSKYQDMSKDEIIAKQMFANIISYLFHITFVIYGLILIFCD